MLQLRPNTAKNEYTHTHTHTHIYIYKPWKNICYLLSVCYVCVCAYTYSCVSLCKYVVCKYVCVYESISWRKKWQPTSVFLPGEAHWQGAWWATVHAVTKIQTRLSEHKSIYMDIDFSVQFSSSVLSDSLRPHKPQHARPPCPSPAPGVYPNSCPLSWWCHQAISSFVVPSSACSQSFPESGSFQMSQLFSSGGQNIRVSASTSVLPMNAQDWFPLGWTGWISLQSKGLSRVFSNTTLQKHQFFNAQLSL